MKGKHTPGPWEYDHAGFGKPGKGFAIDEFFVRIPGEDIAIAADIIDPTTSLPSEPNARLIATAPEMLALLIEYSKFNGEYASSMPEEDWVERVNAIIAKATGD